MTPVVLAASQGQSRCGRFLEMVPDMKDILRWIDAYMWINVSFLKVVLEPNVHIGRVVRCAHWTVTSEADVHEKNGLTFPTLEPKLNHLQFAHNFPQLECNENGSSQSILKDSSKSRSNCSSISRADPFKVSIQ